MTRNKSDTDQFDSRLSRVYAAIEDKEQYYDKWAKTYEHDLVHDLDYVAHQDASDVFQQWVTDKTLRIVDVACGTGLVGECLQKFGYEHVDGVDFSNEMLRISRKRNVYRTLWQHDFTQPADLENPYDALICVGLFSFDKPKISHLHLVVNCVKPGAFCIITVNGAAWTQLNLAPAVHREAAQHGFTIEQIRDADYIRREGIDSRILVIRR